MLYSRDNKNSIKISICMLSYRKGDNVLSLEFMKEI